MNKSINNDFQVVKESVVIKKLTNGTVMQIEKALQMIAYMLQKYPENLKFFCNLPIKFVIFLKNSLLFNSFYCLFCS